MPQPVTKMRKSATDSLYIAGLSLTSAQTSPSSLKRRHATGHTLCVEAPGWESCAGKQPGRHTRARLPAPNASSAAEQKTPVAERLKPTQSLPPEGCSGFRASALLFFFKKRGVSGLLRMISRTGKKVAESTYENRIPACLPGTAKCTDPTGARPHVFEAQSTSCTPHLRPIGYPSAHPHVSASTPIRYAPRRRQ